MVEKPHYGKSPVIVLIEKYEARIAKLEAEVEFLNAVVREYEERANMLLRMERPIRGK